MTAFVVMSAWVVGAKLGWWAMDRYLDSRNTRRERSMRDVTPGRAG
jgi:hypothetical protein